MITDMNKEDKELLLKDLCARLPYGIKLQKFNEPDSAFELYSVNKESGEIKFCKYKGETLTIGDVGKLYRRNILLYKPYLRSMSSMTDEEEIELRRISSQLTFDRKYNLLYVGRADDGGCNLSEMEKIIDYLISHHFDFRGLIEKGLALEAPEGMYNKKYEKYYI